VFDACGEPIHFGLSRTSDATEEWCSLAHAKAWLKVDDASDDELVHALIDSTRNKLETDTRRGLVSQSWAYTLDRCPANRAPILFPVNPVLSVTSVTSYDVANASTTVATSVYRLDSSSVPARLVLKDGQDWPTSLRPENGIEIVFVAGYGTGSESVPKELAQAGRLLMAHWYVNREAVAIGNGLTSIDVPMAYEALIAPHKVPWL